MFYHILDLEKILDGGPWTFGQDLLVYHQVGEHEDPHLNKLIKYDIWIKAYDQLKGFSFDKLLRV